MRPAKAVFVTACLLVVCSAASAHEAGDWLVRFGGSNVSPESTNGRIAALGVDIDVDDEWGVTFNGTYMFTANWGLEVLAALPYDHDIYLDGVGLVGEVTHLPPTVSAQYHFLPDGRFQPYVGLGINFTLFFDEEAQGVLADDSPDNDLRVVDNSFGLAADVGADITINDRWFVNVSFRYIRIDTTAEVTLASDSSIVPGGAVVREDVDINPFVYGAHVGVRF